MLYHASNVPGLTVLEPRASTHGTPYVYALENFAQALVFGAKHDDFDFDISTVDGKLVVSECYPGALERVYVGAGCSVYAVAEDGFERGRTGWDSELVSERPTEVVSETRVDDLLDALRENAEVELVEYRDEPEYRRFVANHVVDRMIRFGVLDEGENGCYADRDERFAAHYKRIVDTLRTAISGELL